MAHDFHYENPHSIHKVDKIVVSAGTNEIKWYNCHTKNLRHEFKPKLIDLILDLKQLFPAAHITFQTVLPIRIVYNYTVDSVHGFNNLLLEVCSQFGCTFYDCFSRFLDRRGSYPNKLLYRDNWHLSDIGLKVLCRALKFLIYGNIFNPIPRYSLYPRYYATVWNKKLRRGHLKIYFLEHICFGVLAYTWLNATPLNISFKTLYFNDWYRKLPNKSR